MRYFESLATPHAGCLSGAVAVLKALGYTEKPVVRMNVSRQRHLECSLYAMHYTEAEVRRARGEAPGALGQVSEKRLSTLRGQVVSLHSMLQKEHSAWMSREVELSKKIHENTSKAQERFENILNAQVEDEAQICELRRRAGLSLDAGEGPEMPPPLLAGIEICELAVAAQAPTAKAEEPVAGELTGLTKKDNIET